MSLFITACGTDEENNTEGTSNETGFFGDKQEEVEDNVLEGSYIVKQGDWIYYALDCNIYKCKEDGSEKTHLATNYNLLVGIYFVNERDQSLYRMKTDGSDLQTIVETPAGNFGSFDIKGEWIYFTRATSLNKVKIDGTEKEMLYYTGMDSPRIIDDVIYLKKPLSNGEQEIYRIDIDAKYEEQAELLAEE